MSGSQAAGLAHSVQARLKNAATLAGRPFVELLELYAVERFLHRLGRSPHRDRFVLKGALLLRAKFDATLGRVRLRYQVDVGLGDAIFPREVEIVPGGLLGMPMASVRAYTVYTTLAEKLEAVVVLGSANSRTKDYYDLSALPRALALEGSILAESIRRTFERRATVVPAAPLEGLSDDFAKAPLQANRWRAFLDKGGLRTDEPDFAGVVEAIRAFAEPVLDAVRDGRPFDRHWEPGGPWR
jgi:hypothetical protein